MKILITGGRGQLGTDCTQVLAAAHEVIAVDLEELDITARSDVAQTVEDVAPDLILNCAAYTRVDACETDRDSAWNVNVTARQPSATTGSSYTANKTGQTSRSGEPRTSARCSRALAPMEKQSGVYMTSFDGVDVRAPA